MRDGAAADVVVLMSIHARDQHRLPVDEELTVAHLYRAEADVRRHRLALPLDLEPVQVRLLGRPEARRAHLRVEAAAGEQPARDDATARVEQARGAVAGSDQGQPAVG